MHGVVPETAASSGSAADVLRAAGKTEADCDRASEQRRLRSCVLLLRILWLCTRGRTGALLARQAELTLGGVVTKFA